MNACWSKGTTCSLLIMAITLASLSRGRETLRYKQKKREHISWFSRHCRQCLLNFKGIHYNIGFIIIITPRDFWRLSSSPWCQMDIVWTKCRCIPTLKKKWAEPLDVKIYVSCHRTEKTPQTPKREAEGSILSGKILQLFLGLTW